MKKVKQPLFRASSVAKLMGQGNELTDIQKATLEQYRKGYYLTPAGVQKDLTEAKKRDLAKLEEKAKEPFEFGQDAKTFIELKWLSDQYGYSEFVDTKQTLKGKMVEDAAIELISHFWPENAFRRINTSQLKNKYFSGTPDLILNEVVEDIKSSYNLKTFLQVRMPKKEYYGQGQVYMDLTGKRKFRVHYCGITTPAIILAKETKPYYYFYGSDENNEHYLDVCAQAEVNHDFDQVPLNKRLKTFEFDYDEKYMKKLKERVGHAREYYHALNIDMKDHDWLKKLKL